RRLPRRPGAARDRRPRPRRAHRPPALRRPRRPRVHEHLRPLLEAARPRRRRRAPRPADRGGQPDGDPMRASERPRAELELAIPAVRQASERIWTSPSVRELYPVWLATMHGIVRSAVPLMDTACLRAMQLAPDDPVAAGLVPYLTHHAPEEAGHDR